MTKAGHTRSIQAVQHAQDDVQGLHQVHSVAAGLVGKVEVLQQPPNHRQQARLLHVIMQKPAEANVSSFQAQSTIQYAAQAALRVDLWCSKSC